MSISVNTGLGGRVLHLRRLLLLWSDDPDQPAHRSHVRLVPERHRELGHRVEVRTSTGLEFSIDTHTLHYHISCQQCLCGTLAVNFTPESQFQSLRKMHF